MIIVYTSDFNHMHSSKRVLAVCSSIEKVIELCKADSEINNNELSSEQIELLKTIEQTQGCAEYEYIIEEIEINTLL